MPRMRPGLAVACFVLCAGCESKELLEARAELAATKGRVAALEKRRADLETKRQAHASSLELLAQQADQAELGRQPLIGALTALDEGKVPDGILLDEAIRAKDPKLDALAAEIIQRQLPCGAEDEPEAEEPGDWDCGHGPLEDACVGVEPRVRQAPQWTCTDFVSAPGFPTAALCTGEAEWRQGDYPGPSVTTTPEVDAELVRVAFEHQGHLYVQDWPPPSQDLYEPENAEELAACEADNEHESCIRSCDDKFGRSGCGDDGYEGEYEEDGDEPPENPELAAARAAAAEAEREAARAQEEVQYQECLDSCGGGDGEPEVAPLPDAVSYTFKSSPAPGLFVLGVRARTHGDEGEKQDETHSVVLHAPRYVALATGTLAEKEDTVAPLETVLDVQHLEVGQPADGAVLLAGLGDKGVAGVRMALDGQHAPEALSFEDACAFLSKRKDVAPALSQACTAPPPAPTPGAADAGVTP